MSKKIFEDIIRRKKPDLYKFDYIKIPIQRRGPTSEKKKAFLKVLLWSFLFLIIVTLGILIGNKFVTATIKITPKQEMIFVDFNTRALRKDGNNGISFEIIQITHETTQTSQATVMKDVNAKAHGVVVIYNNYSATSQALIKNTRLQSPDGKIYRISKAVTIPGIQTKDGKKVPGSVEVEVYADAPGEKYNIGLADFTIPGFKGDSRYEKIYGRSKTEIKGGFVGKNYILEEKDVTSATDAAKKKVESYIRENIFKQKLQGLVFYNNALVINFDESMENPKAGDIGQNFTFKAKGTGTGFLIPEEDLTEEIVKRHLDEDLVHKVKIVNLDELEFNLLTHNEENTEITFNLKGKAQVVWEVNFESLLNDLVLDSGKSYDDIFRQYSSIDRAEIVLRPKWWFKFPKDKSHIRFEEIIHSQ